MSTDRNLLFGVLALQLDLVDATQFAEACSAWATRKDTPLADLLVERGWLTHADRDDVDRLLQRKLEKHGGDVRASLADAADPNVRRLLAAAADPEVRQSLADFTARPPRESVLPSTVAYEADSRSARYLLTRLHAQGGIGQVWLAHDENLGRDVALKELRSDRDDNPAALARFLAEAKITGQLEHPGIVPVYELVQPKDGRPCYTMRFVGGRTLADAIREYHRKRQAGQTGPLDLRALLGAFVGVGNAVGYAHSRGVLHRDLKPQNVALGEYGEVLVLDWGLAKVLGQAEEPTSQLPVMLEPANGEGGTQQGQVLGTPAYMAPEQARGRTDLVDKRSDVYGLGAILYEVLTGVPPFRGDHMLEVLKRVVQEPPVPPRQCVPATPAPLEAVCLKALAKRPEERYASAGDLARDIERWLGDEPVSAWQEPWTVRVRRWLGRHRTLVTAAAACLLVTAVGLAVGLVLLGAANERELELMGLAKHQEELGRGKANEQRAIAEGERDKARRQRNEARRNLYFSQMHLAKRAWDDADTVRMRELLDQHRPARGTDDPDVRGWEWYYLWRLGRSKPLTLKGHEWEVHTVCYSPDGKRLATGDEFGVVKVWDLATGKETLTLQAHSASSDVVDIGWSPDGKRLASVSSIYEGAVKIWDTQTGRPVRTLQGPRLSLNSVCFSPDGKHLACGGNSEVGMARGEVQVWEPGTGKKVRTLETLGTAVCYSPDGKRLAGAGKDKIVTVWDVATWRTELTLKGHTDEVNRVCWRPDGKHLASASNDHTVKVWDAATGREVFTLKGHTKEVNGVCWNPGGKRLATASEDRTVKVWDATAGQEVLTFKGHTNGVPDVSWNPDGHHLASVSDETALVWDVGATAQEAVTFKGHTAAVWAVAFSPDGKRLASAGRDKTVKVWDAATRQVSLTLPGKARATIRVSWSPDGKRLASAGGDPIYAQQAGEAKIWDVATAKELFTLKGHWATVYCACWSPDGKRLATGSEDFTVKIWDAATGREVRTLKGHRGEVRAVCFSPDGKRLASAAREDTMKVWDARTGKQLRTLKTPEESSFLAICWSPDGKRVASGSGDPVTSPGTGEVQVWDATSGRELLSLKGHTRSVHSVSWSPDGKRIASASDDRTVRLWDAQTGQETLSLKGHAGEVHDVCWSRDGKRLASASEDGTVKVWDAATGQEAP